MDNKTQRLIKIGDQIRFTTVGGECALISGATYTAMFDNMQDEVYLEQTPNVSLPSDMYETEQDSKFIKKVLAHYNKAKSGTTGVMLTGLKGSGKTVMAKNMALKSGLPIVILSKKFPPRELTNLMVKLKDEKVCIVIDEIDKLNDRQYDSDYLLQVFDGISTCGNNLIITTCNNTDDVNEYLLDRCSRIRYYREFGKMSPSMIQKILEERLTNKKIVKKVCDFIVKKFDVSSFDNVAAFAEEINNNPTDTLEELFADMNISEA